MKKRKKIIDIRLYYDYFPTLPNAAKCFERTRVHPDETYGIERKESCHEVKQPAT